MVDNNAFSCGSCGGSFGSREELIRHNVPAHGMSEEESRRAVMEKYPEQ